MRCDDFLAALDIYLDDELSIADSVRMHGHLLLCRRCRQVSDSEATLHALLAKDGMTDQPSASLRERIIQQIRRAPPDPGAPLSPDPRNPTPGSQSASGAAGASHRSRATNGGRERP
jgi:putative zinc finger protein